jgi:Putative amidoligase enzyme
VPARTCTECGAVVTLGTFASGNFYCFGCAGNVTRACENCGERFHEDDIYGDYCRNCEDDMDRGCPLFCGEMEPLRGLPHPLIPSTRLCGIEMEFCAPPGMWANNLRRWGTMKEDGSVEADDDSLYPREFAARPASGDRLVELVHTVTSTLRNAGCDTNQSCGLHLHLDMTGTSESTRTRVVRWWRVYEPLFFALVKEERSHNSYCRKVEGTNITTLRNDRYRSLNISAYHRHNSYELRLHHGTIDAKEILSFTRTALNFFDFASNTEVTGLEPLLEMNERQFTKHFLKSIKTPYSINKNIIRTLKRRAAHWLAK